VLVFGSDLLLQDQITNFELSRDITFVVMAFEGFLLLLNVG
jgi:hypothetical protein